MRILLLLVAFGSAMAQPPDIEQIMSRVGRNQAQSQDMRRFYVYNQKQLLRMVRGSGKIAREERREYVIAPRVRGIKKDLARFEGKYELKGQFIAYDKPRYQYKGLDIDGQLLDEMSKEMTDDHNSRDGISREMFPLTYHEQLKYKFKLVKTENYRGRQVYRVAFEPKPNQKFEDGVPIWKGEALVDAEEYQPVLVTTKMAMKIPAAVKILLGTNIKGLGFSVSYQKFEDGVWFPVSYGGEFDVRAVFFYKRTISVSMTNSDFKKTDVNSNIAYATDDK